MRRAARKDENQNALADYLIAHGALVDDVSANAGLGYDMVVAYRSRVRVVEVKNPTKVPSARRLTEGEQAAQRKWGKLYAVVETEQDCDLMLKEMRE